MRRRSSVAALRQKIGELADSPGLAQVADLATRAAVSAPTEIEALTDELAAPAYDVLTADELDELVAGLEPIADAVSAVNELRS